MVSIWVTASIINISNTVRTVITEREILEVAKLAR